MLQEIISEKNLVWNKHTINIVENFSVKISDNVIDDVPVSRIETFEVLSGTKILRDSNRTVLGVMFQRNFIATGHVAAVQWQCVSMGNSDSVFFKIGCIHFRRENLKITGLRPTVRPFPAIRASNHSAGPELQGG